MARKKRKPHDTRETHLRYQIPPGATYLYAIPEWNKRLARFAWRMRITPCGLHEIVDHEKLPVEDFLQMQKKHKTTVTSRLVTCKKCRQHIGQSSAKKIR